MVKISAPKYKAILIFGPPGVGKGTQAKLLAEKEPEKYFHFSTGDMFRALDRVENKSPSESKIKELIAGGNFVSDDLTIDLFYRTLARYAQEKRFDPDNQILILDGIPRNESQVDLISGRIQVVNIISLVVRDYSVLVERLEKRALLENRADDANEDTVRKRLQIYDTTTAAVVGKYPSSLLIEVDGLPAIPKIHKDIVKKLDSK